MFFSSENTKAFIGLTLFIIGAFMMMMGTKLVD